MARKRRLEITSFTERIRPKDAETRGLLMREVRMTPKPVEWRCFKVTGRWHLLTENHGVLKDTACGKTFRSVDSLSYPIDAQPAPSPTCEKCLRIWHAAD